MTPNSVSLAILQLADEHRLTTEELVGGLMITLRSVFRDDQESSDRVKRAFCKFIDDTVDLKQRVSIEIKRDKNS